MWLRKDLPQPESIRPAGNIPVGLEKGKKKRKNSSWTGKKGMGRRRRTDPHSITHIMASLITNLSSFTLVIFINDGDLYSLMPSLSFCPFFCQENRSSSSAIPATSLYGQFNIPSNINQEDLKVIIDTC